MADLAGRLNIELKRRDGGVEVTIRSSRMLAAGRVFVGKGVEETVAALPALFNICATAQACACVCACEAALGTVPSPAVIRKRRLLVDVETIKEHLWRMLLDWPRFLEMPPRTKSMQAVLAAYAELRAALAACGDPLRPGAVASASSLSAVRMSLDEMGRLSAEQVLGISPSQWLAEVQTGDDLLAWAGNKDTVAARLLRDVQHRGWSAAGRAEVTALPRLLAADLEPRLCGADGETFVGAPVWKGQPRETSPYTRWWELAPVAVLSESIGSGLLSRFLAQLVELASLLQDLESGLDQLDQPTAPLADSTKAGVGIAQVPAARGLLVHRVEIGERRILDYRILAPTEWNFHPRGAAAAGLSALPPSDTETLRRQASLFVTALDPCVEYYVSIV